MDFIDKVHELAARIPSQIEHIQTEEATKNAFVLPFIAALGYNVFDPREVIPEFTADVGTKKNEKVDYAILIDGKPSILFECKWCGTDLDKEHANQLCRYFSVTDTRFGVLTNGIVYRFYSDLEKANIMDKKPFLEIDLINVDESLIEELKKFTKASFNLDNILTTAAELKYTREIKKIIDEQTRNPSDEFIKFFASQVYSGRMTGAVREQFSEITKSALKQFINDKIGERLKFALEEQQPPQVGIVKDEASDLDEFQEEEIITTDDEFEGYYIVKTILREIIDAKRVNIRDVKRYCNILLDDNIRKPICRLYFNTSQKYLGIFDEQKNEERVAIDDVDMIYDHADRFKSLVKYYDENETTSEPKGVRGSYIDYFELSGVKYDVDSWRDMLLRVCNIMRSKHGNRFNEVLSLVGRKRPFFSRNPTDLRSPVLINGTDIYVETHHSANGAVRLSKSTISLFGYTEEDLVIHTK